MVKIEMIHYVYIILILIIIILIILKKDIVFVCIFSLFLIGTLYHNNILAGIQTIYKGIIVSGNEFWSIIVTISLIVSMSDALSDLGADILMVKPFNRLIKSPSIAFWVIGILMMMFSFVLWPSPAVALIGAVILPVATRAGLPKIWAAVAMNLFGHGVALSGDYFIQGAPTITARAIGVEDPSTIMKAGLPLWITMSVVSLIMAYIMMIKDVKKVGYKVVVFEEKKIDEGNFWVKFIAIITPIIFGLDVFLMYLYNLKGGDAAALLTGSAVVITIMCVVIKENFQHFLYSLRKYIVNGFLFGIETFAPILVIGAFFFLGNEETAIDILGTGASGYLGDLGIHLSTKTSLSVSLAIIIQAFTAAISGLGGAGFSALPLVGTIASTLSSVVDIDKSSLASLGQIFAIWVGGGTIIPWGVIAVAAICKVNPIELVRKNLIPVIAGFIATISVAIFIY